MSGLIGWIAAQDGEGAVKGLEGPVRRVTQAGGGGVQLGRVSWQGLGAHNFPACPVEVEESALDRNPDLWLYRDRTVGILRRYLRLSLETGRLPSMMGRELFRAKVSSYPSVTFEDRVIFVRDVEKYVTRLAYWDQQLIARVILQEHNHGQAAYILHCSRKTIERRLPEVLDLLSEEFLRVGLLVELPEGEGRKKR